MKANPNREARSAWATRHGLNPREILEEPYQPVGMLHDGQLRYELRRWRGGVAEDGTLRTETVTVDVPADDPLPPQYDFPKGAREEFADTIQRIVDERLREYVAHLERMCEAALTDPAGRGVLVLDHEDGSYEMSLNAEVPYGAIHHRRLP